MKVAPFLQSLRSKKATTQRPRHPHRYYSTFPVALGVDEPRGRSRRAVGAST
jgi:hypothetical protein